MILPERLDFENYNAALDKFRSALAGPQSAEENYKRLGDEYPAATGRDVNEIIRAAKGKRENWTWFIRDLEAWKLYLNEQQPKREAA